MGGDQIRDFCYVTNVIAFHNLLIKNDEIKNGVFNVSTGIGTSISNLARMVADIFDLDEPVYENVNEGEMSKEIIGRKRLPLELKRLVLEIPNRAERGIKKGICLARRRRP